MTAAIHFVLEDSSPIKLSQNLTAYKQWHTQAHTHTLEERRGQSLLLSVGTVGALFDRDVVLANFPQPLFFLS